MENSFNFYENSFAISVENPKMIDTVESDLLLSGDPGLLANAIIAQMKRHKYVADLILKAAYNFAIRYPDLVARPES